MDSIANGTIAYVSGLLTVFGLYPYRDFVKHFRPRQVSKMDVKEFCVSRYRGMATNPSQPMLIAAPHGLLYGGYVFGGGGVTGALVGGFCAGYGKTFVGTVARRMTGGSRYDPLHRHSYKSLLDCLVESRRHFGTLSFFSGGLAASMIAVLWHGVSLAVLQQNTDRGFFTNWWDAFRIHTLMTFLTAPVRNGFKSALSSRERSGGVRGLQSYVAGEAAVFREASGVMRSMAQTEGLSFFFHGVIRSTFKTSVPFGLTYALFKAFGGSIGYPSGGRGGHGGSHTGRHFSRRF